MNEVPITKNTFQSILLGWFQEFDEWHHTGARGEDIPAEFLEMVEQQVHLEGLLRDWAVEAIEGQG